MRHTLQICMPPPTTVLSTKDVLISSSPSLLTPVIDVIISALQASSDFVTGQDNVPQSKLPEATANSPGRQSPSIGPLEEARRADSEYYGGEGKDSDRDGSVECKLKFDGRPTPLSYFSTVLSAEMRAELVILFNHVLICIKLSRLRDRRQASFPISQN